MESTNNDENFVPIDVDNQTQGSSASFSQQQQQQQPQQQFYREEQPNEFLNLNLKYLKSPLGYLRLVLVVLLFCGWISAAAAPVNPSVTNDDVRIAYLFFTIIDFFFSILVFIVTLLNLLSFNDLLKKFPQELIVAIHDICYMVIMFSLAIAVAARQVFIDFSPNTDTDLTQDYRTGAYASASFFAFMSWIIFIITAILGFRACIKRV